MTAERNETDDEGMLKSVYLWEHAHVHASLVAPNEAINLEDLACDGMTDDEMRVIPSGQANSIVWLLWHMARSEDVGINVVLARQQQVLDAIGVSSRPSCGWP